ncbi:MAG: hypothetical protein O3B24_06080 [Verrucomicrobia bacterium]|nr:hypothetical protein [Verrucomicrobiota bacterium]
MKPLCFCFILAAAIAHAAGPHAEPESPREGATFKEGVGISLGAETRAALGLVMADAAEGELSPDVALTAQVYRAADEGGIQSGERRGCAYASAMLPPGVAAHIRDDSMLRIDSLTATGRVVAINDFLLGASGQYEVLIEIPDPGGLLPIGTFVSARMLGLPARSALLVPGTAILKSATEQFVFLENGSALLRVPVATGAQNADQVEILDGLYDGDKVAASAVETLYLIELRATKGGGHCH